MEFYLVLIIVVFLSALSQGITGFAQALISMAILPIFMPMTMVTPLVLLNGIVINSVLFFMNRRHFDVKKLLPLLAGAAVGIPVGAYSLTALDETVIRKALAAVLFLYSAYSLSSRTATSAISSRWAYFFGFLAGSLGAAFNTNGPPVIVYTTLKKWNRDEIIPTLQSFFLVSGIIIAAFHAVNGLYTAAVMKYLLMLLPALGAGVMIGDRLSRRIDQEDFRRVIFVVLILLSFVLFFK